MGTWQDIIITTMHPALRTDSCLVSFYLKCIYL